MTDGCKLPANNVYTLISPYIGRMSEEYMFRRRMLGIDSILIALMMIAPHSRARKGGKEGVEGGVWKKLRGGGGEWCNLVSIQSQLYEVP